MREIKKIRTCKIILGLLVIGVLGTFQPKRILAQENINFNPESELGDWGDAIDPSYPTLPANNGACHRNGSSVWLGSSVSIEDGPQDSNDPDGTSNLSPFNTDGADDGVEFLGSGPGGGQQGPPWSLPYVPGQPGAVRVLVSGAQAANGYLHGWIDWNHDGDWDDAGEQICGSYQGYQSGVWSTITFTVPEQVVPGDLWTRFRVDLQNYDSYLGAVNDGEVEDYLIEGGVVPVELNSFDAKNLGDAIKLLWRTRSETENLGFHLLRSKSLNGSYSRVNKNLIAGAGTTFIGKNYEYTDLTVKAGETYCYKLVSVAFSGYTEEYGPIQANVSTIPESFELGQNYPNPFNPKTLISIKIREFGQASLKVYDIEGRLVRTLVNEALPAGTYQAVWDGSDDHRQTLPSGSYIYKLECNGFKNSKQMMMLR